MAAVEIRAVHTAASGPGTPPFDTLHCKVHYPARRRGSDGERLTGMIPADPDLAPAPVVLLCNGINVGPESYGWLAQRLAAAGMAVVTYSWVGELFPGQHGLSPGIDLSAARPETYGTRPTLTAVEPIVTALAELSADGPLAGALDLDRIAIGGHSAGGTVVLQSADTAFFPALRAAFTYGAHNGLAMELGWPEGEIGHCPGTVPLLMMGGTNDGVITRSADRYGTNGHARDPLERTFDEALDAGREAYLAILRGANHFSLADPQDPTTARGFLDGDVEGDDARHRSRLASLISAFLRLHLLDEQDAAAELDELLRAPPLAVSRRPAPHGR
jgi:predicted dienelactone hydrolase